MLASFLIKSNPIMKSIKLIVTLVLICLLPGTSSGKEKQLSEPYFFIQIADPQFGFFTNNKDGFEKETELYEKAVLEINRLKPDFVIITGDLVHKQGDMLQIVEFKRITAKINPKIPVLYTPGNHDVGQVPDKHSIDEHKFLYGYDRFTFIHKGSKFIGYNSALINDEIPDLEQQKYEWLRNELIKSDNFRHTILFAHHPIFLEKFEEPKSYYNLSLEHRDKYLNLFEANKVDAVFFGHLHKNIYTEYKGIQLVTTSSVGRPLGPDPSGLRIVKVFEDRIEHIYYGLDEVPETITFD